MLRILNNGRIFAMTINCKLCTSRKVKIINRVSEYKLLRCLDCQVVFISPQPKLSKVELNNLERYDSGSSISQYFNVQEIFSQRAKACVTILKKYKNSGYLLDVGCSFGFYLRVFNQAGYKTFGIDISKVAIQYINSRLNLKSVVGKFDTYKFPNNKFDIITMFDVFEHFSNPKEIILKTKRILKKDGIIVIQTPNFNSIMSGLTGKKWFWLLVPPHLFLYSINTLRFFLKNNGFKILYISTWDDHHEFMSNILSLFGINYWGKTSLLHRILVKFKYPLIPLSYLWNIFFLGGEILIYAQKE